MSGFFENFEQQLRSAAEQEARRAGAVPWYRRRRTLAASAIVVLGLAAPAAAKVAGLWDPGIEPLPARTTTVAGSATSTCAAPPRSAPTLGTGLDPALRAQLAVLRRPQRPDDHLPANVAPRSAARTVLPDTVRYVGSVAGRRYFAGAVRIPPHGDRCVTGGRRARVELCLLRASGGTGCGTPATDFRVRGMRVSSGLGTGSVVAALVPDGVVRVSVRYGSSKRSFEIHDNFYGYRVALGAERRPDAVAWTLHDGRRQTMP